VNVPSVPRFPPPPVFLAVSAFVEMVRPGGACDNALSLFANPAYSHVFDVVMREAFGIPSILARSGVMATFLGDMYFLAASRKITVTSNGTGGRPHAATKSLSS